MKKLTLIAAVAFIALSATSCKKDYTCKCSGTGGWDYSYDMNGWKKKDATASCDAANSTWSAYGASCELSTK